MTTFVTAQALQKLRQMSLNVMRKNAWRRKPWGDLGKQTWRVRTWRVGADCIVSFSHNTQRHRQTDGETKG